MSYSAAVLDLDPYFYFPMSVFTQNAPEDFQENESGLVFGDYGIEKPEGFFSDQLKLFSGGYFSIDNSAELVASEFTYSFWLGSQVFDNPEIFSLHDSEQGFGLSYLNDSKVLIFTIYSDNSYAVSFEILKPSLITFVFSGSSVLFYINDSLASTHHSVTLPDSPQITLGSLKDLQALGEITFSDFFYIKQALSSQTIKMLYSLGIDGYETLSINEQTNVSITEGDKTFFQTAWQAYGEVTTKR